MSNTVTIYTSPACSGCVFSKRYMDKHNINYIAVDVTENPAALELIRSLGYATAPVFILGEEHWQGFQPGKLDPLRVETAA